MESTKIERYKTNMLTLLDSGIVCCQSEADAIYDVEDLKAIVSAAERLSNGKPFPLLMLINEYDFLMTKEARNFFNTYQKAIELIKAEAVVVNSHSTKILYNLLTVVHAPAFPFKAFKEEKEAVDWLLKYV